jgi:enoyl-CoA hydratase/carnithine racemase
MPQRVEYTREDHGSSRVASVRLDDGKANAMQNAFFDELHAALDRAGSEPVHAVVIHGREDFFSGGLDLKVLPDLSASELRDVTNRFAETMRRVFLFPKPVIAAAAGHTIAGGMMLYLAADIRLAVDREDAYFGLNEATTGIPLLGGTAGVCQYGIPRDHHTELILHGRMIDAPGTLDRGITDELVDSFDELLPRALERAAELADVDLPAYRTNKRILREPFWRDAVAIAEELSSEAPTENVFARIRR